MSKSNLHCNTYSFEQFKEFWELLMWFNQVNKTLLFNVHFRRVPVESKKATVFVEVLQMQDNLITRQTFTYSKATVEILEELGNMFKVNRKDTRTTSLTSFGCLYCQIWKYFIHFSSAYIVDFEQVNVWRTAYWQTAFPS